MRRILVEQARRKKRARHGGGCRRVPLNEADWPQVLDTGYDPSKNWPPGVRRTGLGELVAAGAKRDAE
jgi:hypothetical protein